MAANMKTNFTMKVSFCTYKSVSVQMQLWECSQNLCMPFLSVQTLIRLHGIIFFPHQGCNIYVTKYNTISLVLRPSCPAFVACSTKSRGRPGRTYCVMRAAADVTFSLVCSLSFTLLSLNSVCPFCSVCPASPIADGSIVASYSTWHQPRHASRDKSIQAFPRFSYCKRQKLGMKAWEQGYNTINRS